MSTLSEETIKTFVLASHTDLEKVKLMMAEHPDLLNVEYDWGPGGKETGLGAASHMGNRSIAEYFLAQGAPATICTMAMLGETDQVKAVLAQDPALANARGAHGIPVMFHVAMSGKVDLAEMLLAAGCQEGFNSALHGAISFNHQDMVAWLLTHGVTDANVQNFQKKTPLERAIEEDHPEIAELLRTHRPA